MDWPFFGEHPERLNRLSEIPRPVADEAMTALEDDIGGDGTG
jgi:hypothetical protein